MRIDGLSRSSSIPTIERAARDFEAMAIGNLIKPMFDTVDTAHGPFGGGDGESAWKPILIAELGRHIAADRSQREGRHIVARVQLIEHQAKVDVARVNDLQAAVRVVTGDVHFALAGARVVLLARFVRRVGRAENDVAVGEVFRIDHRAAETRGVQRRFACGAAGGEPPALRRGGAARRVSVRAEGRGHRRRACQPGG